MGFNITEIVQTRGWKLFMAKVYGWGASVVLVGAMFKIMHWPGAGFMLVIGLSTEAFIFFTSAFEPLHEEYDWSLVYPELAGMHDNIEDTVELSKPSPKKSALEKFDELLNSAQITPELFDKLGNGLRDLNQTTEKIADVSNATVATNNYVSSFEKASQKVNEFADIYGQSAQTLNTTAGNLSNTYEKTSQVLTSTTEQFAGKVKEAGNGLTEKMNEAGNNLSNAIVNAGKESANTLTSSFNNMAGQISSVGSEVAQSYSRITESINKDFDSITEGSRSYSQQLVMITKNLTALNAVYEMQLQGSNEHLESAKKLFGGMEEIMQNMKDSVDDVKRYREEVSKLGQNLSAMNTIYGNMLSAMNFPKQ